MSKKLIFGILGVASILVGTIMHNNELDKERKELKREHDIIETQMSLLKRSPKN